MGEIKKNKLVWVSGLDRPIVVVLGLIKYEGKILLINRNKPPYIGQWGLPGGKVEFNEMLREAMLREVKEEIGLSCEFVKFNCVEHKRMYGNDKAFVAFYCTLNALGSEVVESEEGELKWFGDLPDNIIKADKFLINNCSEGEIKVPELIVKDERDFEILD